MKFTLPDTRGWVVLAAFALTFYLITLIAFRPELAKVDLFSNIAMLIVGSGAGSAFGYYLGSSKGSADKDAAIQAAAKDSQS